MKVLSGSLKLELAQYREMLAFTKFGSDIDSATAALLHRGERLVETLKQPNNAPKIIELEISVVAILKYFLRYLTKDNLKTFIPIIFKYIFLREKKINEEILKKQKEEEIKIQERKIYEPNSK